MTVAIAAERMTAWWQEAAQRGLFEAHWREVGRDQEKIILNPDFERWLMLERAKMIRGFTVRNDGVLVGYAGFVCAPHLHYKDHTFAVNDVIYLAPEHRGITGVKFLKFMERELAAEGVSKITYHLKTAHAHDGLFESLGYVHSENIREKLLI